MDEKFIPHFPGYVITYPYTIEVYHASKWGKLNAEWHYYPIVA